MLKKLRHRDKIFKRIKRKEQKRKRIIEEMRAKLEDMHDLLENISFGSQECSEVGMKIICLRTKTEYVNKPTELRDYTDYWIKRLIENKPTHFRKHNQHGVKSSLFRIVSVSIVYSPEEYLNEGILHTEKAIKLVGIEDAKDFVVGDVKEK